MALVLAAKTQCRIFSTGLMVSLGADDSDETRQMVSDLNEMIQFWNPEQMKYMEYFINLVKSRTDALSVAIMDPPSSVRMITGSGDLTAKLRECESSIAKYQSDVRSLQSKIDQLKANEKTLSDVIKSFSKKCRELTNLQDESGRQNVWSFEMLRVNKGKIAELERELSDLKKKTGADTAQEQSSRLEQRLKSLLSPDDASENKLCVVPTRDGKLVLLKHVYNSWQRDGCTPEEFPSFRTKDSVQVLLADPSQIMLIRDITQAIFKPTDPPFKIQFKRSDTDQWYDVIFVDQIRIAAAMFNMKSRKSSMEWRVIQNNQLMISIAIEQDMFKFGLKTIFNGECIPSRLVVTDGTFDFA